jgi:ketosteroid isomerase-like protein
MSDESLEIVRDHLEGFNAFMRGEISSEAFGGAFDPAVELHWHDQRVYPDMAQHVHGAAEIVAFTERYRDDWTDLVAEPLEMTEPAPGRVLVLTRQSSRGRKSGVPIVIHFWGIWTIRDGKVREVEYFRHRADALEAAGLAE